MILSVSNIAWAPAERLEAYDLLAEAGLTGLEIAPGLFFDAAEDAFAPDAATAEAYRRLYIKLQFSRDDMGIQNLMITSPKAGAGKSTTSLNLAFTTAQAGKRTLVIDAHPQDGRGEWLVLRRRTLGVHRQPKPVRIAPMLAVLILLAHALVPFAHALLAGGLARRSALRRDHRLPGGDEPTALNESARAAEGQIRPR